MQAPQKSKYAYTCILLIIQLQKNSKLLCTDILIIIIIIVVVVHPPLKVHI